MSTKFEKNMEDIFDLPEKIEASKEIKPVDKSDETVDTDFKYARENLYNIIEKGSEWIQWNRIRKSDRYKNRSFINFQIEGVDTKYF